MASPRTRGSTRYGHRIDVLSVGFPAHAGIDPYEVSIWAQKIRLPRARGDRPQEYGAVRYFVRASPRTRGSTSPRRKSPRRGPGFPAHAGIDHGLTTRDLAQKRLPRARGDRPVGGRALPPGYTASPRTRGSTCGVSAFRGYVEGFPAHAGIDLSSPLSRNSSGWLPRARGDRPVGRSRYGPILPASPRTRGSTSHCGKSQRRPRGFPAHAGIDPAHAIVCAMTKGLPRARGDRPDIDGFCVTWGAASPRTRGSTPERFYRTPREYGFPAHAGIDLYSALARLVASWLPRARGDRPFWASMRPVEAKASPRTRGSTLLGLRLARSRSGFPAHAGIDLILLAVLGCGIGLPRARGDRP